MTETSQQRILVLFAHPSLEKSRVNRRLVAAVETLPGVKVHDLYEAYPDFHILAFREQELLAASDVIVLQFPFFWYSTPSILKEWQDIVLQHGWAYGSEGVALRGKTALSVVTTGGNEGSYQEKGYNRHTMRQFLSPISQTWQLCGVSSFPPFVVHGTLNLTPAEIDRYAADYRRTLEQIRDGKIESRDPALRDLPRLNRDVQALNQNGQPGQQGDSDAW